MARGKLIAIEGTDCSGKETQTNMLVEHLRRDNISIETMSFPRYYTPTGRIIAGPCLGKEGYGDSFFDDFAKVDPLVASLNYVGNRIEARPEILDFLNSGINVIADRYVHSNAAHQGGKISDPFERQEFYNNLEALEFGIAKLPRPDLTVFLYMPYEKGMELREKRGEAADAHERDPEHLRRAEEAYLQLSEMHDWARVDCVNSEGRIYSKDNIHEKVYSLVERVL